MAGPVLRKALSHKEENMKKTVFLMTLGLLVLSAHSAWALDMEFYTYGGFDLMTQAFNTIALIFSDINYKGILTVFAVYGLLGGGLGYLAAMISGQRQVPLMWAAKVIGGAALYLALFVPTGNIAIYDATLNKTQTIGGVPNAVVFTAGTLNLVERAVVKICDMSAAPNASYSADAYGIGFNLLQNMSSAQDVYASMSMERYMKDCVEFEVIRPGGLIGFGDLTGANTNFLDTLARAVNPAVYTVYYEASSTGGTAMTCTDAWSKLLPLYSAPGSYDTALKNTCSNAYLNTADAVELQACKDLLSNTVDLTTGTSYTYDTILRQQQLSQMLYQTFMGNTTTSAALQSDRTITSSGFGTGIAMNQWIPIIKSIMTAIAIGLVPFLALLLPTPLVGKAISVLLGFFVYLTVWGIVDAVIHMSEISYATNVFGGAVGPGNLGMLAMANIPTLSAKVLAMFGIVRGSGLMIAAVLTGAIIKFGGSALAHLAGSLAGAVQQGGLAGGKMFTPEGRSAEQQQLVRDFAGMTVESQEKFSNRGRAMALEEERRIAAARNIRIAAGNAEAKGEIAPGSADSLQTQAAMLTGQMNLATNEGKFNPVVGPDGKIHMADSITSGSKLSFGFDEHGKEHLAGATITSIDPVKMTHAAMQMNIQGASHSFRRSNGIEKFLSEARQAGGSDVTSRTQSDAFSKTFATNFERNIGEGSDFAKNAGWNEQKQLRNLIAAHGGLSAEGNGASIGADGSLLFTGADGHQFKMKVSESTANALRRAEGSAFSEAFNQTASSQEGLAWASSIAQKSGNTEAYSLLNEARKMSRAQESTGENLTAAFVTDYAKHHFDGSTRPEALQRAADFLNNRVTEGGLKGQEFVHKAYADFYARRGGYGNGTPAAVEQGVRDWGGQATGGVSAGIQPAMSRARAETGSINPDKFQGGQSVGPWSEKAKGIQSRMDGKAAEMNSKAHEREATNHFNVEQGGSVLGTIQKPPETEQEALRLSPGFKNEMNRIMQQAEGGDQGDGGNR